MIKLFVTLRALFPTAEKMSLYRYRKYHDKVFFLIGDLLHEGCSLGHQVLLDSPCI